MSDLLSDLLMYFNLIVIPLYCFRRFRKKSYLILLNPCFYLLFFSYIYLTLSSALIDSYLASLKIRNADYLYNFYVSFSQEAMEVTTLLGNWFTLVFFLFYIFSADKKILPKQFKPKKITYYIALFFTGIVSLIFLALIIVYGPTLIAMFARGANRGELLSYFAPEIYDKYKVNVLIKLLLASIAVIVWRKKNFKWYIFILLPIVLELLSKGRTLSFAGVVFLYINYVFIAKKTKILIISLLILLIVGTGFVRYGNLGFDLKQYAVLIFSDAILTRFSSLMVYDRFLDAGDLGEYFLFSSLRFLPVKVVQLILGYEYKDRVLAVILDDAYRSKLGFSLASNIVGEALYYGGITFAILSPIIMGSIFYSMNQGKIYRTFPGFIFFCFMMSSLQHIMRSAFYDKFLSLVYLMFSYLIWISILEGGRVVFIKVKKNYFIFPP